MSKIDNFPYDDDDDDDDSSNDLQELCGNETSDWGDWMAEW